MRFLQNLFKSKEEGDLSGVPDYRVGDLVVVKQGVMCPDKPELSLAGWQGRITELYPEEGTLLFEFDTLTLRGLPDDYIRECEIEGLGWDSMVLGADEVLPAKARDNEQERAKLCEGIEKRHRYDYLADENPGIREVLGGLEDGDIMSCLAAWEEHLSAALKFPFEAKVAEQITRYPVGVGEKVLLTGLEDADDLYGLLVNVRFGRKQYTLPLCDLEATDENSPNYQPLRDYVVWFANR